MNYHEAAVQVLEKIGGKENLISGAHCATRLRLVVKDEKSIRKEEIEEIEGVKGVFIAQGQLQIIFGTGVVNRVYEEFVAVSGIETATKEDVKAAAGQKMNPFKNAIKVLGDIFRTDHSGNRGNRFADGLAGGLQYPVSGNGKFGYL